MISGRNDKAYNDLYAQSAEIAVSSKNDFFIKYDHDIKILTK